MRIWRWSINWDGDESCVTPCFFAYVSECSAHDHHYKTFTEAKKTLIQWHMQKAKDHRATAKSWRKQKKEDWT